MTNPDTSYNIRYEGDSCITEMQGGEELDALVEASAVVIVSEQPRYTSV